MKYTADVYRNYGDFFAKAIEIAKDKVGLYNQLLSSPMRKQTESSGFRKFLEFIVYVLRWLGWGIYVAIAALLALGLLGYLGGMGTLIATNPVLAAALAILGGQGVYLVWKHRVFMLAQKRVGANYKRKFDTIRKTYSEEEKFVKIEELMKECVISLCIEAYQINNDAAQKEFSSEL
jgi:hypothetical protein